MHCSSEILEGGLEEYLTVVHIHGRHWQAAISDWQRWDDWKRCEHDMAAMSSTRLTTTCMQVPLQVYCTVLHFFLIRLHWVVNSTASTNGDLTNGFCSSIKKRKGTDNWLAMHIWSTVSWIPRQTCMIDQAWWMKHMHRISWLVGRI